MKCKYLFFNIAMTFSFGENKKTPVSYQVPIVVQEPRLVNVTMFEDFHEAIYGQMYKEWTGIQAKGL